MHVPSAAVSRHATWRGALAAPAAAWQIGSLGPGGRDASVMRSDASAGRERRLPRWERANVLRAGCLLLIVVQNSSLIMVTSYSRTLLPPYAPTVAVFFAEVLKMGAALALLACEKRSLRSAMRQAAGLAAEHGWATLQFAVPALCYTMQNYLWYFALSNLDSVTAAVTSQMKVITTAVASVVMLGRRLSTPQWATLLVLTGGLVVIQLKDPGRTSQQRNTALGGLAMLLATVLSAYSGVFLEKLFKTVPLPLWLQSLQLSAFALPISAACMLAHDAQSLRAGELLSGFNRVVWCAVGLNALGGLAVSMALKYADNILKTFAVGVSIVLNCAVSAVLLDAPLTPRVILGVTMVVGSTCAFNACAPPKDAADGELEYRLVPTADPNGAAPIDAPSPPDTPPDASPARRRAPAPDPQANVGARGGEQRDAAPRPLKFHQSPPPPPGLRPTTVVYSSRSHGNSPVEQRCSPRSPDDAAFRAFLRQVPADPFDDRDEAVTARLPV